MKMYNIITLEPCTVDRRYRYTVKAESEEEAIECIKDGIFSDVELLEEDTVDYKISRVEDIELIECF